MDRPVPTSGSHAGNLVGYLFEAQLDHRPRSGSVSLKYLNKQEKQKPKRSISGAQANDVVLGNNSMMLLESPAGVS